MILPVEGQHDVIASRSQHVERTVPSRPHLSGSLCEPEFQHLIHHRAHHVLGPNQRLPVPHGENMHLQYFAGNFSSPKCLGRQAGSMGGGGLVPAQSSVMGQRMPKMGSSGLLVPSQALQGTQSKSNLLAFLVTRSQCIKAAGCANTFSFKKVSGIICLSFLSRGQRHSP